MAMPVIPEARRYSVEEVLAFPADGNRYEVVQGELLVTPAPRWTHQFALGRLYSALRNHLSPLGLLDTVAFAPADITLTWRYGERAPELRIPLEELFSPPQAPRGAP